MDYKVGNKRSLSFSGESDESGSSDEEDGTVSGPSRHNNLMPPYKQSKLSEEDSKMEKDGRGFGYSDFAQRMMGKMGHREGTGLGKHGQGRVEIVEASKQRGRRGLGLRLEGLEGDSIEWNEDMEEKFQVEVIPEWLPPPQENLPAREALFGWYEVGKRKLVIDDETEFCDEEVLESILKSKSIFDKLGNQEFLKARTRANAVETVRGGIFQNRAAMKMAEIDASFDFMFTGAKSKNQMSDPFNLLYFADICAGPGGFSEYVLWKLKWHAKGFGLTLKEGANDFKIDDFLAGSPETFEPHYGKNGYSGDGDIFKEENLSEFRKFVLEQTDNQGVSFVMADGGFSVEGQENIQEILSKQLYLCQFLCAISILKEGGHFLCKLFDVFTEFSLGLIYLFNHAFEQTCIFKPHTSRPANSERYIVCKRKRADTKDIHDYLFEVNQKINRLKGSKEDVNKLVPLSIMKTDTGFYQYMCDSNNKLGTKQVNALTKIRVYVQNTNLPGDNQGEIRRQCLRHWQVPDEVRAAPRRHGPESTFDMLMKKVHDINLSREPDYLTVDNLKRICSTLDHKCIVSGGARLYILGLGRMRIFRWDVERTHEPRWTKLGLFVELPRDTLIEAEIVQELKGEGRGQRRVQSIQIIDGLFLGGEYIGDKPCRERLQILQVFVKALKKPTRRDMAPLRLKQAFRLSDAGGIFDSLSVKQMKEKDEKKLCFPLEDDQYFVPIGMHIMPTIRDPWFQCHSRSQRKVYYFNKKNNHSVFDHPGKEALAPYQFCLEKRLHWRWADRLDMNLIPLRGGEVSKQTFLQFIGEKGREIGL